jgi:DNA mismatch repair protein MutL
VASIRLLDPQTVNAIAAGEVIERPASVVKELVENALDAHARRISIEVKGAGQELIRVVDDGDGIPAGEASLAFVRHATSKIGSVDDLQGIATLGFRGEALPSIAAVARVACLTAVPGAPGTRLRLKGGTQESLEAAGAPSGTTIEVRDLFFNTPARLKFLKKPATEAAAIGRLVSELAVAYPEVAFTLTSDGRKAVQTPGSGHLGDAVHAVFGGEAATQLLPLHLQDAITIRGVLSQPRYDRTSRDFILLFVNRRRIWHRALTFAVEEAYRGLKDPGRFPLAVILMEVDPSAVDVNVHPTKREVRFQDESRVFGAVQRACYEALRAAQPYRFRSPDSPTPAVALASAHRPTGPSGAPAATGPAAALLLRPEAPALPPLRLLGQVLDCYLLAESPDGVVIVDQHAAHEKILFHQFMQEVRSGRRSEQLLLIPVLLEVTPAQCSGLERATAALHALGFELDAFGGDTLRITAAPAALPPESVNGLVEEVLNEVAEEAPATAAAERIRKAAASLACHAAVTFHQPLAMEEQRRLLDQLERTPDAIACPHGRPTMITLSDEQLRREFRRP